MLRLKLIETEACVSRKHCGTCRDRDRGRWLREAWGKLLELPGDSVDFECPHGATWRDPSQRPVGSPHPGSLIWAEIHRLARAYPYTLDAEEVRARLGRVESLLSLLGCDCRTDAAAWLAVHPPDFGLPSDDAATKSRKLGQWSLWWHNHVNRKLGRPEWTWEQSAERWGWIVPPASSTCPPA